MNTYLLSNCHILTFKMIDILQREFFNSETYTVMKLHKYHRQLQKKKKNHKPNHNEQLNHYSILPFFNLLIFPFFRHSMVLFFYIIIYLCYITFKDLNSFFIAIYVTIQFRSKSFMREKINDWLWSAHAYLTPTYKRLNKVIWKTFQPM